MAYYDEYAYNEYSSSKNTFAMASIILGGIAIVTFSSIIPAIFAGSLSIIFAILSRKGTGRLHPLAKVGAICSSISVILGIAIFVFYMNYIPQLLQDDAYRNQMEYMLESIYGQTVDVDGLLDSMATGNLFGPVEE